MKKNNVSAALLLDTDAETQNNTYPVKLKLTFHQQKKLYNFGLDLSVEAYKKVRGKQPRGIHKESKQIITENSLKAMGILNELNPFTFKGFEDRFIEKPEPAPEPEPEPEPKPEPKKTLTKLKKIDFYTLYQEQISSLNGIDDLPAALRYDASLKSLKDFREHLPLDAVDELFIKSYELWMHDYGKATKCLESLKCLRGIYNIADRQKLIRAGINPFIKHKALKPSRTDEIDNDQLLALSLIDIKKLFNYIPNRDKLKRMARDFWMFSYLCHGISAEEIILLKESDLSGGFLYFNRNKTNGERSIKVHITSDMRYIMNHWKQKDDQNDYFFEFLKGRANPENISITILSFENVILEHLPKLCREIGIWGNITFETARNSFASVLRGAGVSVDDICLKLGDSSPRLTKKYLYSIKINPVDDNMKSLIAFKYNPGD